jgi:hypothetical protein
LSKFLDEMISRANKSFVWLWMVALLCASVGVSVQQVYCYCLGKTTVSLFAAANTCHDEKPALIAAHCCSKNAVKRSCCKTPDAEQQGCTKRSTRVFQLKAEYEVASSGFKKLDVPKLRASELSFFAFSFYSPIVQGIAFQYFEQPPPALSGRLRCLRFGVFRC